LACGIDFQIHLHSAGLFAWCLAGAFRTGSAAGAFGLHGRGGIPFGIAVQQVFCRLIGRHTLGHGIGLPFVLVTVTANAVLEPNTAPLLHHVCCFVGG
jgi:hypothetical protein